MTDDLPQQTVDGNGRVKNLIRLALFKEIDRTHLKKTDISQKVFGPTSARPQEFQSCMLQANEKLHNIFGLELQELPLKQRSDSIRGIGANNSSQYILVNKLNVPDNGTESIDWKADRALIGVLGIILVIIFVQGGKLSDDDLYVYIRRLGLNRDHPHPSLNMTFDQTLTKLEKQGYLQRFKVAHDENISDDARQSYTNAWGPRAKLEMKQEQLLDLVCRIYGDKADDELRTEIIKSNAM